MDLSVFAFGIDKLTSYNPFSNISTFDNQTQQENNNQPIYYFNNQLQPIIVEKKQPLYLV